MSRGILELNEITGQNNNKYQHSIGAGQADLRSAYLFLSIFSVYSVPLCFKGVIRTPPQACAG